MILGSGFIFELDTQSSWYAPLVDSRLILESSALTPRIQSFFYSLDISQAKGFGAFIPCILRVSRNESIHTLPKLADPILEFAKPIVLNLVLAGLTRDNYSLSRNANALIGLGNGLTPSGDDFIGGLLFALHIHQNTYSGSGWIHLPVETYSVKTNLISHTLLQDLANGHAIAPLHEITKRLLSGESFESIYPFISQLTSVGNSTGWDLLAGLLTGFLILYQSSNQNTPLLVHRMAEA